MRAALLSIVLVACGSSGSFGSSGGSGNESAPGSFGGKADAGSFAPRVAMPQFNPPSGTTSDKPLLVALATPTFGARIFFTLDSSVPTEASARYTAPIPITGIATIRARAFLDNHESSLVADASYKVTLTCLVQPVDFAPMGGEYATNPTVTLTTETPDATICYTLTGKEPRCEGTCIDAQIYEKPFAIDLAMAPVVVTAIACKAGMGASCLSATTYRKTGG
jgi:hypothetical protein